MEASAETERLGHIVIGTAGHIDHGKTALVKALTGVETDRLREEKKRGISIELGFAPFFLPSGMEAAFVDVPGHEKFIKNMLAGATGIDMVLLVIAADDGVMAQTIEHLAIVQLLGVRAAVVALTKVDLVDAARVRWMEERIRQLLVGSILAQAPIVPVSAERMTGLEKLVEAIESQAANRAERLMDMPVKLPLDHSFIIQGVGRVVTGTLASGILTPEQPLELLPAGQPVRVRRLEIHGNQVSKALAGQRVAINLVTSDPQPKRGDFLCQAAAFVPAREVVAEVTAMRQADRPLKRGERLRVYIGAQEILARLNLLEKTKLEPGESGFARLTLEGLTVAAFRDRFILRSYSPIATVAGGVVLESRPQPKKGRIPLERLSVLAGDRDDLIVEKLLEGRAAPMTEQELAETTQLGRRTVASALGELEKNGKLLKLTAWRREYFLTQALYSDLKQRLLDMIDRYRQAEPYQFGPLKEEARAAAWPGLSSSQADMVLGALAASGVIVKEHGRLARPESEQNSRTAVTAAKVITALSGFSPPGKQSLASALSLSEKEVGALLTRLEAGGEVVRLGPDIYFSAASLGDARDILIDHLVAAGEISVARYRELLGTSRKYAVPLLEYFDRQKITRRHGDQRLLFDPLVDEG